MITGNHDCGWGTLTRSSTCTLIPPGSDDTALLKRKTQSSVPSSPRTAPSTIVGSSVSVSIEEGFNDWGGRKYDDLVFGEVTKIALPGMRLHDSLHGWQACPQFIAFDKGVGQICLREGLFSYRSLPKRGQNCYIPAPPPPPPRSLNGSEARDSLSGRRIGGD